MNLTDQIAFITGGASGLGLATAHRVLAGGGKVVLFDLPASAGKQVADDLGDRAVFTPGDVTSAADVAAALDRAAELGPLRIAVNCAGIGNGYRVVGKQGPFPLEEFTKVVTVNLIGTFNVIRLAAERIATTDELDNGERGVIVNTASIAGYDGQVGQAAYSASKGGIIGLTLPVARDLASIKIRVVTIAPGLFNTPLLATLPSDAKTALGAQVPHPARLGDPDEYGLMVTQIIENSMLNGETIRLDGAIRLPPR